MASSRSDSRLSSRGVRATCINNADCADGNPCTDDICDLVTGCSNPNNTAACSDGNLCTTGDVCAGGTCGGTPVSCTGGQSCNPTSGLCAGPFTATFRQDVNGYTGTVDTYVDAGFTTTSNAAALLLTSDGGLPVTDERQTMIRFDNIFGSGPGQVPIGSSVTAATLTVNVSNGLTAGNLINVHRMLRTWGAANTWSTFGSAPWNGTPGIQADGVEAVPIADLSGNVPTGSQALNVTSSLQAWAASPSTNDGWVFRIGVADSLAFDSSEVTTVTNRPLLTVTYNPPGVCTTNTECDDDNVCTDDTCDVGSGVCSHTNNAASCDDVNLCTTSDACSGGECTGTPVSCTGGESCNPDSGQCVTGEVLVRQPYLQSAAPTSMTIVWRSATASGSRVHYGTTQGTLDQTATNATVTTNHIVTITGLLPATRYYYDVGSTTAIQAGGSVNHFFETSPPANDTTAFRVWALGDSGDGGANQLAVRNAMLTYTSSNPPDLMLHLGDIAYSSGTDSELTNKHFAVYKDILRNTPSWTTLGNHDGTFTTSGSPNSTGPYYDSFVLPTSAEAGGSASGTEAYYSFDRGNAHFIVLNSFQVSRSASGPMAVWLQADLAATDKQWVIAFWHHPPYTKGTHNSDTESELIDMRQNLLPILEAGGVDLVLTGHSHNYERSYLIDGTYVTPTPSFATLQTQGHIKDAGDGKILGTGAYVKSSGQTTHEGAVYVVAGHGGADESGSPGLNHPVMYFSETAKGSCILDIGATSLTLTNVRSTGVVSDNFTIEKGTVSSSTNVTFQQGTAGYTGTQDTFVHQNFADTVEGSVVSWKWDTEDPAGFAAFGLIRFDNIFGASAGQIPVGATITSATLTLVGFNSTIAPAGTINEAASDWQASTATWNNFGGDAGVQSDEYRATPSYTAPLLTGALVGPPVVTATAVIDVTASLQSWSSNTALNFGWVFRPNATDGAEVYSAEQTTANQRPLLSVTYTAPAATCAIDQDCDDNNLCNGAETCVATVCQAGTAPNCDDGLICTTDSCVPANGCVHANNTVACTDGNA